MAAAMVRLRVVVVRRRRQPLAEVKRGATLQQRSCTVASRRSCGNMNPGVRFGSAGVWCFSATVRAFEVVKVQLTVLGGAAGLDSISILTSPNMAEAFFLCEKLVTVRSPAPTNSAFRPLPLQPRRTACCCRDAETDVR